MAKKKNINKKAAQKKLTLKEQLAEEKDRYLRLFAEFDNYRKRTTKERVELYTTAGHDIMTSIVSVIDDLERCINQTTMKKIMAFR